jgi:hypothetical protein
MAPLFFFPCFLLHLKSSHLFLTAYTNARGSEEYMQDLGIEKGILDTMQLAPGRVSTVRFKRVFMLSCN